MSIKGTVGDYMTRSPVVLNPEMGLDQAARLLLKKKISGAPVVDNLGMLAGLLTEKDCFKIVFQQSYYQTREGLVADYMTIDVETMSSDTDIVEAAQRFLDGPFRRFPVVTEGRLVGIISRPDALRALFALG